MENRRSIIVGAITIVLTLFLLGSVFGLMRYLNHQAERSSEMHQRLDRELSEIQNAPGTAQVQHVDAFRGSHGNVANYYKSSLSYDAIRAYYDEELKKRGWKFKQENKLETWGKDLGESLRIYCKNPLAADIYFTGKNQMVKGYTYSLSVSWRVVDECGE